MLLQLTYTPALLCCFLTGNISNNLGWFLSVVFFLFQSCISKDWAGVGAKPPYTIGLNQAGSRYSKSWSQMDVFVPELTLKVTPPLRLPLLLQHLQMKSKILSFRCSDVSTLPSLSLWFPYANKDPCLSSFTPDLMERNQWQDNIRAAISTEAEGFQAGESGKTHWIVTQVVQTSNSIGILQWAHTHTHTGSHMRSLSLEVEQCWH